MKYTICLLNILNEIEGHPDVPDYYDTDVRKTRTEILSGASLFPKLPRFDTFVGFEYLNDHYQQRLLSESVV